MDNRSNNIKQKLDAHEFDFNPKAWEQMEQLLEGRTPKKSYFFTKTISAMITGLFLLWLLLWKQDAPTAPPTQAHTSVSTEKTVEKLPQPSQKADLTNIAPTTAWASNHPTPPLNSGSALQAPPSTVHHLPSTVRDTSFFQKLASQLTAYRQQFSPEKVYLQFDRPFFEPGEPIWFNAWVRDANSLKASPKSDILYVELLAPNGSVLNKITLLAKGGTAAGDFQLDAHAPGGMYKIKAYTNWQRNSGDAFERDLQVQASVLPRLRMELDFLRKAYGSGDVVEAKLDLNTLANQPLAHHDFSGKISLDGQQINEVTGKTDGMGHARLKFNLPEKLETNDGLLNVLIAYNGQTESISRSIPIVLNKIDLQFLPEGGDMVAGLPATVAFKALNEWGKPADVEGKIVNAKGLEISSFRSYHQGMGAFHFTPNPGETYTAKLTKPEGIQETFPLPDALPRGYTLQVAPPLTSHPSPLTSDSLIVQVNTTEDEALNVALVSRGEVYFSQTLSPVAGAHLVKIPLKNLPIGVAQVALFDSREIPRAERLVFLNPHKQLKINVKTDKEKYLPREKVQMTVEVTDERGIPMPGQFALSVADDNLLTFADDRQGHILSELLLQSDLTGKVEEPDFYFEPREKHPEKDERLALDFLMLTQGWRRLAWERVMEEAPVAAMEFEGERAVMNGQLLDVNNRPCPNIRVKLSGTPLETITDENGRFSFDTLVTNPRYEVFAQDGWALKPNHLRNKQENGVSLLRLNFDLQYLLATGYKPVRGKVTTEDGEPLIGATILLKGTPRGTVTDVDGSYEIAVPPGNHTIVCSYTGYESSEIENVAVTKDKATKLDIKMNESDQMLSEVVVTGYSTTKRKSVTSSVKNIESSGRKKRDNKREKEDTDDMGVVLPQVEVVHVKPLIEQDNTTQGKTLTSDEVKNLPTRDFIAFAAVSPGVGKEEEKVVFQDQSIEEEAVVVALQGRAAGVIVPPPPPPPAADEQEVFKVVESQPQFQGGEKGMLDFISKNLRYPVLAKDACVEGSVIVSFVVEKDGSISEAKVVRDIGAGAGEEALRMVQSMNGKWTPGTQRGRPVRVQYTLPVKFKLDGSVTANKPAQQAVAKSFYTPRQFYAPKYDAPRADTVFVRNDFRKTVFFQPQLQVGRNGKAVVEFYNTDAISTFRATVEGIATDGSIGRTEQRFFTQMPFGMDVKAPTHLLTGDRLAFPLTLSNNTDQVLSGTLAIETPAGFRLKNEFPKTVSLKAGETKTVYPEYELAFDAKGGRLAVSFIANGQSDAFGQALDVQPRGFPVAQVFGGSERERNFNVEINDPVEGSLQAAFNVHPSVLSNLTTGLDRMLKQPSGCFEQTSSSNYPNLLVLNFLKTSNQAAPAVEARARQLLDAGYKRLLTFEIKGGGFEWFGSPPAHEMLTAYGLMEFVDMLSVYPVDRELIDRTAAWLLSRKDGKGGWQSSKKGLHSWQQPNPVSNAYITWAMTEAGYGQQIAAELTQSLNDARATHDPYLVALVAKSLLNLGDRRAAEMLDVLTKTQAADGSWTGKTQSAVCSTGKNLTVETTALAALAFLANANAAEGGATGAEMLMIEKAVRYLAAAKTQHGFGSTQATVLALKALVAYAQEAKKAVGGAVALYVNGNKVKEANFTADEKTPLVFGNLEGYLKTGKNEVQVRFTHGDPLPYDLSVRYHTRQPLSSPDCKLSLTTTLTQAGSGKKMGNVSIQVGETQRLTATLTNRSGEAVPNPIALVGIPAGLSVQPWQVKELQEKKLCDFYEIKDGYVIFYFRHLEGKEQRVIHLDLKADIPGEYEAPASSAYLYYSNDAVVWSKPDRITIDE
jgi:TonB family protein